MTDFTYSGNIEFDTIASSGLYDITADGAQGGASANYNGGDGAAVGGDIYLAAGTVLEIVVGGPGGNSGTGGGGGGGGSFIFETFSGTAALTPILIAGGGGGGGLYGNPTDGGNAIGGGGGTSPSGGFGGGYGGGEFGIGGGYGAGGSNGGGGGGFTGGAGAGYGSTGGGGWVTGNNFSGGLPYDHAGAGGFGGGGGGGVNGGGGGGGYGGGGGGGYFETSGGGGGGSYLDSALFATTATAGKNSGYGDVSVTPTDSVTFRGTGIIQYDTIALSGTYAVTADGAQGGGDGANLGGDGASVGGDIYLTAGTELEIIVGGEGAGGYGGGGGGGSFIFETFSGTAALTPILIAGGGGGAGSGGGDSGGGASTAPTGGNGGGTSGGVGGLGGVAGAGGGGGKDGGGGGYTGGAAGGFFNGYYPGAPGTTLASSFQGGVNAGGTDAGNGAGGFGGGGGGGSAGGGGGGGFGGGGGANGTFRGGGGGSFLSSKLTDTFATGGTVTGSGEVVFELLCFLHGTRILTPVGAMAVEDLAIGDSVVTRFGGMQRIRWLGRQSYAAAFVGNNPEKWPVCIKAGALEDGVPARDLSVSPGHSILLDDTLVLASRLVNGVTVTQARPKADVHYVQIELSGHDCVVAEGAWAETFADAPGLRAQFHNAAEFYAMYPDAPPAEALRLCAPRPERGAKLAAALMPVVERAGVAPGRLEGWLEYAGDWKITGWARDLAHPDLPVPLEILTGDHVIGTVLACDFRADLARAGKGRCAFRFVPPKRLTAAVLASLVIRRAADQAELPGTERFRHVA